VGLERIPSSLMDRVLATELRVYRRPHGRNVLIISPGLKAPLHVSGSGGRALAERHVFIRFQL